MSEHKPGTVARVDTGRFTNMIGLRYADGWLLVHDDGSGNRHEDGSDSWVRNIRPLVVLDPEKLTGNFGTFPGRDHAGTMAEWLRKLADNDREQGRYAMPLPHVAFARRLAEVIASQAQPPKPDEPREFGAKVTALASAPDRRKLLRNSTNVWEAASGDEFVWDELSDVTLGWDEGAER